VLLSYDFLLKCGRKRSYFVFVPRTEFFVVKPLGTAYFINSGEEEEEEEEEEDLFVFNDTIEGPRAPAVKPGRVTQA
jgi:hypothetical protein